MTIKRVALVLLCLMSGTATAEEPKVTPLMSKDLAESPGREVLMLTVEHAPGGSSAIHRHNAHAFVYVLEGSVVMQLKGGQQVSLTPGQTFYEGPEDVHVVDRNASATNPAKFLVFLIKDKGLRRSCRSSDCPFAREMLLRSVGTRRLPSGEARRLQRESFRHTSPPPARLVGSSIPSAKEVHGPVAQQDRAAVS
ncbi:MAG: cupin domain-containing protein [Microvirga sp.]|jgi:quercetin dioxygenase-like cupin family protein